MAKPSSLARKVSPPPPRRTVKASASNDAGYPTVNRGEHDVRTTDEVDVDFSPALAAIEAGQAKIRDHLEFFTNHLGTNRGTVFSPSISIEDFQALYRRNQHSHGRHFVVHQHDHPVSGVHYDLRLQFSSSSAISFAIPYGLPGNPNSVRPNRMGVETRVHTLWNNLIETASHATGSLLIWDTGEYDILPYKQPRNTGRTTDDEREACNEATGEARRDSDPVERTFSSLSQSERLFDSFQRKRIRLRLHGTKLPANYTLSMWLPSSNDRKRQPKKPARKRRRLDPAKASERLVTPRDSESDDETNDRANQEVASADSGEGDDAEAGAASDAEDENETIRANNAYPGAENTIGSIHQRNWILTLDRRNSGFRRTRSDSDGNKWIGGFEPFFVRGRDYEKSVVTGRSADEVMEDEGVEKFVGRKMWRPILE